MPATQKDIAQRLGISQYSVSHALKNSSRISLQTRQRVRRMAQKLGYRVNTSARAIRRGRFGNIALLISADLRRSTIPTSLLGALHDALAQRRIHLTVTKLSDEALTDENFVPQILREWSADGLLINYHKEIPPGMEALIERCGHAAIWLNCKRNHDAIRPDDFDAGWRLTRHFIEQGHRHIAYMDMHCGFRHEPEDHYSNYDRWDGYAAAMREAGLAPRRIDAAGRAWRNRAIYEFWTQPESSWLALPDRPTAVVAYGADEVSPLMLASQALGLRLPQDLAIGTFGEGRNMFDGLRLPAMMLPHEEMGRLAVEMLLHRIDKPLSPLPAARVAFRPELNPPSAGRSEPPVDGN